MTDAALVKVESVITSTLAECSADVIAQLPTITQTIRLAHGVNALMQVLTDDVMKKVFMPLQGSPLGFVTDKDREGGYKADIVRECVVEAMLKGLRPIGNEFNIISGRMYAAKNGMARLVATYPGLTDLVLTPGVPQITEKGALVEMRASWKLNGKPMFLERVYAKGEDGIPHDTRICVKVNNGMGPDAVIGKATRKALKAIYDVIAVGAVAIDEGDAIDTQGEVVSSTPAQALPPEQEGRRMKMPAPTREPGEDG
jgi:hypothetical protein